MMLTTLVLTALIAQKDVERAIEVPFRLGDDAIIVDAVVNGKKCSFMFDTGYSGSIILNDQINVGPVTGVQNLRDFVGTFQAGTVKMKSLSLGEKKIDAKEMEITLQPVAHMSLSYGTHCDGIMGFEVIRDYVTEINFEKRKFIFHPRSLDISKRTPDNKKTFLNKLLPIGVGSMEIDVFTKDGKRLKLALDTGNAFFATTHKDCLVRVGLWAENKPVKFMRSAQVASGPVDSWYKLMTDMKIFGVDVPSSVWSIIDLPSSSAEGDGTVGFGFLKNFNIIIDMERRRVWMENFTGKTGNEMLADVGIIPFFFQDRERYFIGRVIPNSPAAAAGIRVGDELLGIDGQELLDIGQRKVMSMLEGPEGSEVQLTISRDGTLLRPKIKRALLINGLPGQN